MGKKNANISIYRNGQKIASQTLKYESGKYDFTDANFILKADKIGFQTYTVKLEAIDGEYTFKNNQRSFYVEVIDSRNKVLLLSGAPHPDISALKSVLDEYEGSEVITSLYSEWNKSLDGVDLIIWHEPGINFDQNTLQLIKQKNIPIFFYNWPEYK